MNALHQKYENDLNSIRLEMENKFKAIFEKIDIARVS